MERKITISDQEIPTLIEYIKNRIEATKVQLSTLEKTLDSLLGNSEEINKKEDSITVKTINPFYGGGVAEGIIIHADGYDTSWTWINKVEHILKRDHGLTTNEIVNKVLAYEPQKDRATVLRSVSALLSSNSKEDGRFERTVNNKSEFVYYKN